jgi:hypothetical protein
VTARMLLLGLAVALASPLPAFAGPAGDPVLTDAPPPVPLGIIEGSTVPMAPRAPRPVRRAAPARPRVIATEKPMDRWARIPRPQSRAGSASAFPLSNGYGGDYHGSTRSCD